LAYFTSTTQAGDWFLGTLGDMMLMYTNLRQAGVGGFAVNFYWSSTENNSGCAWRQLVDDGYQSYSNKGDSLPVRAVRAFNYLSILSSCRAGDVKHHNPSQHW
jgi:hypothetical protein